MNETAEIRFERQGRAGVVTLDRPHALNAVTHGMVRALDAQLRAWAADPAVAHVLIRAAGDKAFSAGGDIRHLYDLGKAGDPTQIDFFRDEYRLNVLIHRYPKPFTALIDGIVMGGGVGISVNGRYRVGTERIIFAMPEVGIGFFPDVGGTWILPRAPGELGMYLALTGARLRQADARYAGIVTHTVPRDRLGDLAADLLEVDDPAPLLAAFDTDPGPPPIAARQATIDALFSGVSVGEILKRLDETAGAEADWAAATAREIRAKSPTSLEIAFRQMRFGRGASFEDCMRLEYRIVSQVLQGADFYEGIRAVIVDKDMKPRWRPAELEDLEMADIEAHFLAPDGGDLEVD
ncbi:enoyl-CoA hydratase/isomerase family protein [Prosthecomicrobium sp. N25]|uniref:enoyl-CoA hydratase/isomerase family protein n=1 Tax=Prosthecomicrobium sp. N25 TaxID=3129254 RepID=UPI0030788F34